MNEMLEIKAEMVRRRIRQRSVARHLGISEAYLSDLLNGIRAVDSQTKKEIRTTIESLSGAKLEAQ